MGAISLTRGEILFSGGIAEEKRWMKTSYIFVDGLFKT